jgi:hypothetical protein
MTLRIILLTGYLYGTSALQSSKAAALDLNKRSAATGLEPLLEMYLAAGLVMGTEYWKRWTAQQNL